MGKRQNLTCAKEQNSIVRIFRANIEDGWVAGFVHGVGKAYVLIEVIDDSILLNGYQCMKISDVSKCLHPSPYADFMNKALKLRGLVRSKPIDVDLTSTRSVLQSLWSHVPLVSVHQEVEDPDICHIGRIKELVRDKVSLQLITPCGQWDSEIVSLKIRNVTRIDFLNSYEKALHLVSETENQC